MAFRQFDPLNVPEYWEKYFTKYPQGMTILESLFQWVDQVDKMSLNINEWNVYLKDFVETFDKELQANVVTILSEWQESGFLDVVINEALQTQIDDVEEQVKTKQTFVTNVAVLRSRDFKVGEQVSTLGYHAMYDGGKADYIIVQNGTDDGGVSIKLNNGLYAQLNHNGTIYSKQYGIKSNNVDDDSAAFNKFFKMFGVADLFIQSGVSLITETLFFEGLWNPSTNNGSKRTVFNNHSFNYQGVEDGVAIHVFNHQKSVIDGLAVLKSSKKHIVNFAAFWYSECINFDLPKIAFNKNNIKILDKLKIASSYTFAFRHGVSFLDMEFYGVGTTYGSFINSALFDDVKLQGNQIPNAEYNVKFYGKSFQNFLFKASDLSYSTKAIFYIDERQERTMRVNFEATYLDSKLPVIENYDFKGAVFSGIFTQLASSQLLLVKTKNFLSSVTLANYGLEASSPKQGGLNLARNGDLLYRKLSGWVFRGNGGTQGLPDYSFVSNEHQIHGWSLRIPFIEATQYVGFNGIKAPMEGMYNVGIRVKKVAGNGKLRLSFNPTAPIYDLSHISDGEELILTANTYKLQGDTLGVTLTATEVTANMVLDVYEVTITPTEHVGINLVVHPKAIEYPDSTTTANRPEPNKVMQTHFDQTLNKVIFVKTVTPPVWIDVNGTTV